MPNLDIFNRAKPLLICTWSVFDTIWNNFWHNDDVENWTQIQKFGFIWSTKTNRIAMTAIWLKKWSIRDAAIIPTSDWFFLFLSYVKSNVTVWVLVPVLLSISIIIEISPEDATFWLNNQFNETQFYLCLLRTN